MLYRISSEDYDDLFLQGPPTTDAEEFERWFRDLFYTWKTNPEHPYNIWHKEYERFVKELTKGQHMTKEWYKDCQTYFQYNPSPAVGLTLWDFLNHEMPKFGYTLYDDFVRVEVDT